MPKSVIKKDLGRVLGALLLVALIFCFYFNVSSGFAQNAWVDNKEVCQESGGNWRLFNNNCGDSCEKKFSLPVCTSILIYNCDCGDNACFDGDKCISDKIAQKFWKDIEGQNKAKRKKELEDLKINSPESEEKTTNKSFEASNKIKPLPPISNSEINPPKQNISEMKGGQIIEEPSQTGIAIKINDDKKSLCAQQNGFWKEFDNGCVDNCSSKISEISICTQEKTFGCGCGDGKCWDNAKKSCIEIEKYRKSITK